MDVTTLALAKSYTDSKLGGADGNVLDLSPWIESNYFDDEVSYQIPGATELKEALMSAYLSKSPKTLLVSGQANSTQFTAVLLAVGVCENAFRADFFAHEYDTSRHSFRTYYCTVKNFSGLDSNFWFSARLWDTERESESAEPYVIQLEDFGINLAELIMSGEATGKTETPESYFWSVVDDNPNFVFACNFGEAKFILKPVAIASAEGIGVMQIGLALCAHEDPMIIKADIVFSKTVYSSGKNPLTEICWASTFTPLA